jgi:hypothetical protein
MPFLWLSTSPGPSAESPENELPRWLDIKQLEQAAPRSREPGRLYILAWHASEWTLEDKEHRHERCLVLRVLDKGDSDRWFLCHLYREPQGNDARWHVSMNNGGMLYAHGMVFKDQPKNKDIYDALKAVDWSFERGTNCVDSGVWEKRWREAVGEKPTRFFWKPKDMIPPRPPE